jgi:hypothetical protein
MDPQRQGSRWIDLLWLLVLGSASSIWCLTASTRLSATFDEPFYLESGLNSWRSGSNESLMRAGTMPLPVDIETLPLFIWERARGRMLNVDHEFDQMLRVARAANLVFWWLLLIYGFRLGALYGGSWGGRLTVLLFACEPNLLAHAGLATMDVAVTACLLVFVYHYQVGLDGGWLRRVGVPGICYGLALLAKASALAFVPVGMVALHHCREWSTYQRREGATIGLRSLLSYWRLTDWLPRDFWKIIGIGLLTTFLYCGSDWKRERSFVAWADKLPPGIAQDTMKPLAENLRIFPNAGSGLAYQIKHNIRGHGTYLFGDWSRRAVPHYFPMNLLIKLTLPVLALTLILLLLRPRALATPLGLLTLVLLGFSVTCRVQIGIRLILPLVAFLMVALAVALVRAAPGSHCQRSFALSTIVLAALSIVPLRSTWPDGLRHTNPLWGGNENGYRHLSDSNYDWGQGLNDLQKWRTQNGSPPMKVWYYGKDPRFLQSPDNCPLHNMPIKSPVDFYRLVGGHYLAVSTSILYRDPTFTPASVVVFDILKGMQPVARTSTFFIYDFTGRSQSAKQ